MSCIATKAPRHGHLTLLPSNMRVDEQSSMQLQRHYDGVLRELRVLTYPGLKDHDYILPILAYGWTNNIHSGRPYLVVEYSDHGTLTDYLQRVKPDLNERREYALDIAAGLNALHDCKIVHGDVKPHNVLVFDTTDMYRIQIAKLADFGGSLFELDEDQVATYGGTSIYKAPEKDGRGKYKGPQLFTRSQLYPVEVYSFGLTVWEILNNGIQYIEEEWARPGELKLDSLRRIYDDEEDGIFRRGRTFCRRIFGGRQPTALQIAILKTFSATLRDNAAERSDMGNILEVLAHGTEYASLPHCSAAS